MKIRKFVPEERELYLDMAQAFYQSPAVLKTVPRAFLERTFDEMMRSDVYVDGWLLLTDQDAPMGYMLLSKTFCQEAGGLNIWLEELSVLEPFRGQGAGSRALRMVEEMYPDWMRLRLEVEPDTKRAIELYRRLGYQEFAYCQMVKDR